MISFFFAFLSSGVCQNELSHEAVGRRTMEGIFASEASVLVKILDDYYDFCKLEKDYVEMSAALSLKESTFLHNKITAQKQNFLQRINLKRMKDEFAREVFGEKGEEVFYRIKQNPREIPSVKELKILRRGLIVYAENKKHLNLLKKGKHYVDIKLLITSFQKSSNLLINDRITFPQKTKMISLWFRKMSTFVFGNFDEFSGLEVDHWELLLDGHLKDIIFEEIFIEIIIQWQICIEDMEE